MNDKQLNIANFQNLTQLWKRMGAMTCPIKGMDKFMLSHRWPNRCWLDNKLRMDEIDSIAQNINQLKKTCIVPVISHTDIGNKQLELILTDNDFKISSEQTAMYLDMNTYAVKAKTDLELLTVSSEHDIDMWTDIASISFNYEIDASIIHSIAGDPDVRLITARVCTRPVATAMLFHTGNIIGLHQMGVLPVERGQGIAYHLMNDVLLLCLQLGAEYITLQASTAARGLYEKLGFISQYNINNYQRI